MKNTIYDLFNGLTNAYNAKQNICNQRYKSNGTGPYYYPHQVWDKHRTYIGPFVGEPKYTPRTEWHFNEGLYNQHISEADQRIANTLAALENAVSIYAQHISEAEQWIQQKEEGWNLYTIKRQEEIALYKQNISNATERLRRKEDNAHQSLVLKNQEVVSIKQSINNLNSQISQHNFYYQKIYKHNLLLQEAAKLKTAALNDVNNKIEKSESQISSLERKIVQAITDHEEKLQEVQELKNEVADNESKKVVQIEALEDEIDQLLNSLNLEQRADLLIRLWGSHDEGSIKIVDKLQELAVLT